MVRDSQGIREVTTSVRRSRGVVARRCAGIEASESWQANSGHSPPPSGFSTQVSTGGGNTLNFVDLATIAQVGATLAGFAALASAIKGTAYDADGIFDVVANGLVALVFALLAQHFGATAVGLRTLAAGLVLWSGFAVVRDARVTYTAYRDETATYDLASGIFGSLYLIAILLSPFLGVAVVANCWPGQASRLYESALLAHIFAAAVLLLDIVRRHAALGTGPPAAQQGHETDAE